jgi:hypothetical protein
MNHQEPSSVPVNHQKPLRRPCFHHQSAIERRLAQQQRALNTFAEEALSSYPADELVLPLMMTSMDVKVPTTPSGNDDPNDDDDDDDEEEVVVDLLLLLWFFLFF